MEKPLEIETEVAGRKLKLQTGKLAYFATSSILASYGETVVLATAQVSEEPREGADFFPMLVDYEERLYAAGKISGSRFVKREGRPSEAAVLSSRLIDRSLRPLFPKGYFNDVQIIITVLSVDHKNDPDIISLIAASAALSISPLPFEGPISAVRVGKIDDKLVINPTEEELKQSSLDLVVAGKADKVMMLEGEAAEISEKDLFSAIKFGLEALKPTLAMQEKLRKEAQVAQVKVSSEKNLALSEVRQYLGKKLKKAILEIDKQKREEALSSFEKEVLENFEGNYKQIELKTAFAEILEEEIRVAILKDKIRPDGRRPEDIREISIEVGILPRTHGSALFSRGQTQALSIVTLGAPGEEQVIETMEEEGTKRFMHHYNFPPYSTGEVRPLRSVSRREIGHGNLVERALKKLIPKVEEFPYTIRVVSEIVSSNGSTSMASVCGSSLALMDAGIPLKKPVAGISIGLVSGEGKEGKEDYVLLTDILGIEDFAGDMDFKVAGTKVGICAVQLDLKIKGLPLEILEEALKRALKARMSILEKMNKVISKPRAKLSPYAPLISKIQIAVDKIGQVIGPGGKTINKIIAESGGKELVSIDIEEDGTILVSSSSKEAAEKAINQIKNLTKEVEIGQLYQGEVRQIVQNRQSGQEIGAIVRILPNVEGMVHISELRPHHVRSVSEVVKVGQKIPVKVLAIDKERGRVSLSLKQAEGQNLPK